jgi:hypothetical protein
MSDHDEILTRNGRGSTIDRRRFLTGTAVGAAAVALAAAGNRPAPAADSTPARGIKRLRFGEYRREKPAGELADGTRLDVSEFISDFGRDFFASGGLDRVWQVARPDRCPKVPAGARVGPPVAIPKETLRPCSRRRSPRAWGPCPRDISAVLGRWSAPEPMPQLRALTPVR